MLGVKHDQGKPDFSFFEYSMLETLCRPFMYGETEYGRDNWKSLDNGYKRFFNAGLRHLAKINQGKWTDDEGPKATGLPHIECAMVDLIMAYEHWKVSNAK